ncbi:cyclic nucleotide-binding/CBS domain-containing protein [Roseomonas genomospecies 6]|uniref:CBS domain-containing protein n=1 Tax=Roseomonas genomospecies 6 TaxID=214106 RepID=A0A9W7TZK6_9PROT|nr:CBS domain-containing protein [Roseomonas genomospecies 6]KAA0681770.1 CBS domain-containing protein [Roseomonas genomospecies 6]
MPNRKLIPDVIKDQQLVCLPPEASVQDAAILMAERRVAAVLVTQSQLSGGHSLKGIFTERDLAARVVATGRDPVATRLAEVMTASPDTLGPDARAYEALDLMERHHYRHLPVTADGESDGTVMGIVSIRDLFAVVRAHLEDEIRDREAFIFGSHYSASAPP